jgi:hypothetical protein
MKITKIELIILMVGILLLFSCSAEKRCLHHTSMAKKLGCITDHSDTIYHTDTIRGFTIDTVVQYHNDIDTLLVDSGGIKVRTIINFKDRIVTQTINKRDTIFKSIEVTKYKNFEIPVYKTRWWVYLLIVFLLLIILGLAFRK